MYNGVGLPTPRGSGTSGYVQQNLAYVSRPRTWVDFKKEFEQIKANPPKPPKKPNAEIIEHEQKREIEVQLLKFRDKLEAEGLEAEEVERRVTQAREYLYAKMKDAPLLSKGNSHQKVAEKEREMQRLKEAFGIMDNYVPGSAFDFEAIEERAAKEKEERQLRKALEARDQQVAAQVVSKPEPKEVERERPTPKRTERRRRKRSRSRSSSSSCSCSSCRSGSSRRSRERRSRRRKNRRSRS